MTRNTKGAALERGQGVVRPTYRLIESISGQAMHSRQKHLHQRRGRLRCSTAQRHGTCILGGGHSSLHALCS